jgi:hypothetical protein
MSNLPLFKAAIGFKNGKTIYKGTDAFCSKCLRHENHFTGGGSWSPDLCPCGCQDTIPYYDLTEDQLITATKLYEEREKERIASI